MLTENKALEEALYIGWINGQMQSIDYEAFIKNIFLPVERTANALKRTRC